MLKIQCDNFLDEKSSSESATYSNYHCTAHDNTTTTQNISQIENGELMKCLGVCMKYSLGPVSFYTSKTTPYNEKVDETWKV